MSDHHRPETNAVHAGRVIDAATGAVAPPIHLSTTFERDPDGTYPRGYTYATFNNPNRAWLEEAITDLEGGAAAIATSSGMAAIACVLGSLKPGERVIVSYDLFQGTARLLNDQLRQWGIEADVVDTTRPEEVEAAIRPETRMVWVDTPSNPLMRVTDIARAVEIARRRGIRVAVDSTFATFVLQRPLDLGADVTVYAATKYIAGHSDVVNGLAVFREKDELYERARAFQINVGLTPSPFDCWLVHRGLRTLPCRMRAHAAPAVARGQLPAFRARGPTRANRRRRADGEWPLRRGGQVGTAAHPGRRPARRAPLRAQHPRYPARRLRRRSRPGAPGDDGARVRQRGGRL